MVKKEEVGAVEEVEVKVEAADEEEEGAVEEAKVKVVEEEEEEEEDVEVEEAEVTYGLATCDTHAAH